MRGGNWRRKGRSPAPGPAPTCSAPSRVSRPRGIAFKAGLSPPHGVRKAGPGKANPLSTKPAAGQGGQPDAGGIELRVGVDPATGGANMARPISSSGPPAARWPVTRATERRPCHGSAWLDAQLRPSCHPARIERVRRHDRSARSASPAMGPSPMTACRCSSRRSARRSGFTQPPSPEGLERPFARVRSGWPSKSGQIGMNRGTAFRLSCIIR